MGESLVHFICKLPKEEDCINPGKYSFIAKEAFKNSTIENVLLGDVEKVEQSAYENCKNLKFVAWGKDMVAPAGKLKELVFVTEGTDFKINTIDQEGKEVQNELPEIKSNDKEEISKPSVLIQNSAFKGCDKLETVIFPNNKCIIEKDAFAHCKSLRTVVLLGSGTEIYDDPFIGCKDLTIICKKGDNELCAFARAHSFRIIEI